MTAADSRLGQFLAAVDDLPAYLGLTWRGCPADAQVPRPGEPILVRGLLATSRDVDTAAEGRTLRRLYAIASRTGRDISALSARRQDQEIVFRPGSVLQVEGTLRLAGYEVHLVTEILLGGEPKRPSASDVADLAASVDRHLRTRLAEPAAPTTAPPGKFSGDLG